MTEQYPLTLEHVKQFLATKQEQDIVGTSQSGKCCLLAQVLHWQYPEKQWRVSPEWYTFNFHEGAMPDTVIPLERQLRFLVWMFDIIKHGQQKITKAELRTHMKYLASHDWQVGMPIMLSDVFPVNCIDN